MTPQRRSIICNISTLSYKGSLGKRQPCSIYPSAGSALWSDLVRSQGEWLYFCKTNKSNGFTLVQEHPHEGRINWYQFPFCRSVLKPTALTSPDHVLWSELRRLECRTWPGSRRLPASALRFLWPAGCASSIQDLPSVSLGRGSATAWRASSRVPHTGHSWGIRCGARPSSDCGPECPRPRGSPQSEQVRAGGKGHETKAESAPKTLHHPLLEAPLLQTRSAGTMGKTILHWTLHVAPCSPVGRVPWEGATLNYIQKIDSLEEAISPVQCSETKVRTIQEKVFLELCSFSEVKTCIYFT